MSLLCQGVDRGLIALNYAPVINLKKDTRGQSTLAVFENKLTGRQYEVRAKGVINATGAFADDILSLDQPHSNKSIAASQGVHLVLPKDFFPSNNAIIVPKTSDGRVLFVIPWKNHVLVGTTDTPIDHVSVEPKPFDEELRFLLATLSEYCSRPPSLQDCTSVFVGIRPLVNRTGTSHTKGLSRDHRIAISPSGLLTITGGKWTTYRKMAEDCINIAAKTFSLRPSSCRTASHSIANLSTLDEDEIHSQFQHAVQMEFAQTIEDVLARRTRWLFTDASKAQQLAVDVGNMLSRELGWSVEEGDKQLESFRVVAKQYMPTSYCDNPLQ
jgi:glycerol-3-phosphate dehydrogenase